MRRSPLFLTLLFLSAVTFVHAEEWSKTYNISGKPDLRVVTSDADINVDTWDQSTIEAHIVAERYKIGDGGLKITEHQTGDSVDIELHFPVHVELFRINMHRHPVQINIHMPREGRVGLHTDDGAIHLANFKGDMELLTGDGREEIESVDGKLQAKSGDGRVDATGRFDELNIETGDGRIEARALAGSSMSSNWTLRTGDGGVRLELPDTFAANVDLHTSDGHITLTMPVTVEGRLGENTVRGKINGGGNLLTIHTGDGSIRLEKS